MSETGKRGFRLGLVVNPFAGIGGPLAQKGSDDADLQHRAAAGTVALTTPARLRVFFDALLRETGRVSSEAIAPSRLEIITVAGDMGANWVPQALSAAVLEYVPAQPSRAQDTRAAVRSLCAIGIDLLLFAGGDGTARDVCDVIPGDQVCLGIPTGVKMQSGVFAINPQTAASLVARLINGQPVRLLQQEVRDIDEEARRAGRLGSRHYGALTVPDDSDFVQTVKQGGIVPEALLLGDIADFIAEELTAETREETLVIAGPGGTVQTVLDHWGLEGSLLGVDLVYRQHRLHRDLDAAGLEAALHAHRGPVVLLLSVIGGQGHIIGRGNQQITPAILRHVGRGRLRILAPPEKLRSLEGRPLLIDSGDPDLDREWTGAVQVICGYRDVVLYPLAGG